MSQLPMPPWLAAKWRTGPPPIDWGRTQQPPEDQPTVFVPPSQQPIPDDGPWQRPERDGPWWKRPTGPNRTPWEPEPTRNIPSVPVGRTGPYVPPPGIPIPGGPGIPESEHRGVFMPDRIERPTPLYRRPLPPAPYPVANQVGGVAPSVSGFARASRLPFTPETFRRFLMGVRT